MQSTVGREIEHTVNCEYHEQFKPIQFGTLKGVMPGDLAMWTRWKTTRSANPYFLAVNRLYYQAKRFAEPSSSADGKALYDRRDLIVVWQHGSAR